MKNGIDHVRLAELALLARLGKPIPHDGLEDLFIAIEDAVDAQHKALGDTGTQAEDLAETIRTLEKNRAEAVQDEARAEEAGEKRYDELRAEVETEKDELKDRILEMERTCDEWRRRAEKAEHEADQLRAQADRAASWWHEKARSEVASSLSAEIGAREEAERQKEVACREQARLATALHDIVSGKASDAWQRARIALGREIIKATGTEAVESYVPTRAERKRARASRG